MDTFLDFIVMKKLFFEFWLTILKLKKMILRKSVRKIQLRLGQICERNVLGHLTSRGAKWIEG